ncbi:MAG: hypothetical protein SGJ11_11975 [Phycisphaerae bacterium]|nr:hypothetical protein [Phycisphaerae bacterium]
MTRSRRFIDGSGPVHMGAMAAIMLLTVAWYVFSVHPYATASARSSSLLAALATVRADVAAFAERRETLHTTLRTQEQELASSTVRLQPATALNARLGELAKLAAAHELEVERMEPGIATDTPLAVRVPLRMVARGGTPAGVRFMAALRSAFPDVAIESFDLTRQDGPTAASLQLDLVWYADRAADRATAAAPTP